MITDAQFNELYDQVQDIEDRLATVEDTLNVSVSGSLLERVATIERTMVSINQVVALKKVLEEQIESHDGTLDEIQEDITALRGLVNVLHKWRTDVRHELVYEEATDVGAGQTWELSQAWDSTSPIIVFQSALTLVDPSLISTVTDYEDRFASSVVLSGPVIVIYFKKLSDE